MNLPAVFLCLFFSLLHHSAAQNGANGACGGLINSNGKVFTTCNRLPYLSSELRWTYHSTNNTVDIAYQAPASSSGWVAWAINPTGTEMNGANAFLAFHDNSGVVTVYTTKLTAGGVNVNDFKDEELSFAVHDKNAVYSGGNYIIYATLDLPNHSTKQNTLWQQGPSMSNGAPSSHDISTGSVNLLSMQSLDFSSGDTASTAGNSKLHRKNIHGVLNAISWGILMPVGIIIARYVKVFESADPAWFYLHIACQCSAYVLGLAGWILGLKLGSDSVGITYHKHRNLGITIFCLATVQLFALFVRPNKDHKYRFYWKIYHHAIGYSIIVLSIINIFEGFDILNPADKWKHAYIAVIATLGAVALLLEAVTWPITIKKKKRSAEKSHHGVNGSSGYA
ncbi:hypothetical protein Cni_G27418 [Canna indica]|uniref:Cytochrome b561 and DOMON domain-containing protein n=1 Tax=Canna indica TaxID=4628 RepID=A0AAQ3QMY3_9LILI|nr:hypothetical protein Cni_G27418 [Canna indica]